MKIIFVILAAGKGKRFGLKINKLFCHVNNNHLIYYLLKKVEGFTKIKEVVLAANPEHIPELKKLINKNNFKKITAVIKGGEKRQDSVFNALNWIKKNKSIKSLYVGIHDGARLNVPEKLIKRLLNGLKKYPAVIPGLKVIDTIKSAKNNIIQQTIPRKDLYKVSTPQFSKFNILYDSYAYALKNDILITDEAAALELKNHKIKIIEDDLENIKLTYKNDLKSIITESYKIGVGFDIHKLVSGRKLILGGVKIKHEFGLKGHSDADVLIHAIIDALLGAAGMTDIGQHFPDTDKQYKNIESKKLLLKTLQLIQKENYTIANLDTTVFIQEPKLSQYKEKIRKNLSRIMAIDKNNINIKAKTMEHIGPIGRGECIAAQAILLLKQAVIKGISNNLTG